MSAERWEEIRIGNSLCRFPAFAKASDGQAGSRFILPPTRSFIGATHWECV